MLGFGLGMAGMGLRLGVQPDWLDDQLKFEYAPNETGQLLLCFCILSVKNPVEKSISPRRDVAHYTSPSKFWTALKNIAC